VVHLKEKVTIRYRFRDVECKRDWNMEGGYLATLNEAISAEKKLGVGQMTDELKRIGS
jgi:hypothetical protein